MTLHVPYSRLTAVGYHATVLTRHRFTPQFLPILATALSRNARCASSATSNPQTSLVGDRLNPPSSTLPPPLHLSKREPNQSKFSHLISIGRLYASFYKNGLKQIWTNHKLAKAVKEHSLSKSPSQSASSSLGDIPHPVLSRAEFQLILRARHDSLRIPIFVLLFLIIGEWLPLVVMFFTPVVPYTCRIPKQIDSGRKKAETQRRAGLELYKEPKGSKVSKDTKADNLSKQQLFRASAVLGLHSRLWDRLNGALKTPVLPPNTLLRWRLQRRLRYLEQDDALMLKDGGVNRLSSDELKMACEQRGIDVVGRDDKTLKKALDQWLHTSRSHGMLRVILSG
ncbi:hypothetical protein EJ06DRAFT_522090 [Trichodelitschia bisporula]|uniref:Letm1 RBD domain-containing protein n=1 Tax=Trichodelitschia bisporula TaxID=703511 RepID=A0A6G1HVU3_9PEZI|nr:hypothetical protein EJ06DRAFT_522090 [Trichodelitschia bisporula]